MEATFKRSFSVAAVFRLPTIREQVAYLAATTSEAAEPERCLIALQPLGDRTPLFFAHGWGGRVGHKVHLARLLAPEQPLYGLQAPDGASDDPNQSLEKLAKRYAKEIIAKNPDRPIHLMGNSAGGWYAYAVAEQLIKLGANVGQLIIVDTNPIPKLARRIKLKIGFSIMKRELATGLPRVFAPEKASSRTREALKLLQMVNYYFELVHLPTYKPWNRCPYYDYFSTLTYSYRPQPLPVSVHLLTSPDNAKTLSWVWGHYARKGLTIETMLDGHYDFIAPKHQQEIAAAVKRVMERYDNTYR